ncbi:hypothetical protein O181_002341 [Austropuccinia psidii MF-1]|uniref:Integrase catalytic domain-containing protein n=1 Tax=Austropuccinia psidii MF-1 TaxID=1389203 RepID=A0A9Q3GD73_9BASI|nr:hypothetical protein [Austropuccinia psidii MF-1]
MIGKNHQQLIYLNSGAGRTIVNDLPLLDNPTPVLKHINTFSNPVKVTHQGALVFKGIKLYPVYYIPDGPVNLLSVSQLVDNGIKLLMISTSVYTLPTFNLDWHLALGHPFNSYIRIFLKERKIKGKSTHFSDFPVCQKAKIQNRPHSQTLPCAYEPFSKINMDTLQINPPTHKGHKYVLVLIDEYIRFNKIYLMSEKGQAEGHIKLFLVEIKNKLEIIPAYLHIDRGGEFSSKLCVYFLTTQGISLERGPPESPQTNGVAERFHQMLLSKIRCLLGQLNIPVSYWDEAAKYASLLLNLLLHKHLMMKTPARVLDSKHCLIEPEVNLEKLIPFGMKVTTRIPNPASKVEPRGEVLRALRFKTYSDGTASNPTLSMNQPESSLPSVSSLKIKLRLPSPQLTDWPAQSPADQPLNSKIQPTLSSPPQNVGRI